MTTTNKNNYHSHLVKKWTNSCGFIKDHGAKPTAGLAGFTTAALGTMGNAVASQGGSSRVIRNDFGLAVIPQL